MNPSVTVRSTPSESGTSLFILHEGRKGKCQRQLYERMERNSTGRWKSRVGAGFRY